MADMKLRVNFGALKKFQDKMQRELGSYGDKVNCAEMMMDTLRTAAKRCMLRAEKRTPVDTGQLRKNWKADNGVKRGWNYTITVENPVEYASYVEFGHRVNWEGIKKGKPNKGKLGYKTDKDGKKKKKKGWVDGYFMLTKAVDETKQDMPDLVEEKIIKKFLEITK